MNWLRLVAFTMIGWGVMGVIDWCRSGYFSGGQRKYSIRIDFAVLALGVVIIVFA